SHSSRPGVLCFHDRRTPSLGRRAWVISAGRKNLKRHLSEVLQVISRSPGELGPIFETMLANAARLCEAKFGTLYLCEGDALRIVAAYNVPPAFAEVRSRGPFRPPPSGTLGQVMRTKQTAHLPDLAAPQALCRTRSGDCRRDRAR